VAVKRALVLLLLASCTEKKAPPSAVDASLTVAPTTCERGPWDEAARAKHRATAAKLAGDTAPLIVNVLVTKPAKSVTAEIQNRLLDKVVDKGTRALGKEERALYLTMQMLNEVRHGGLHQFFTSNAGNCAVQTREALKEIGHAGLTNVYERALERFPSAGPLEDRQGRWKQIDAVPNAKNAWDETTQAMNRLDDVDEHLAKYVKTRSGVLDLPPRKY
jgi:hypothetical protein